MTHPLPRPTLPGMPIEYPIPLGARQARRSHNQWLVNLPRRLCRRWAIGQSTVLYYTLVDENTVMLQKLPIHLPGLRLELNDPRSANPHVPNRDD